jgi:hypothetical protein
MVLKKLINLTSTHYNYGLKREADFHYLELGAYLRGEPGGL